MVVASRLSCPLRSVGSSRVRNQTRVSCSRQILYHWATKEAPLIGILKVYFNYWRLWFKFSVFWDYKDNFLIFFPPLRIFKIMLYVWQGLQLGHSSIDFRGVCWSLGCSMLIERKSMLINALSSSLYSPLTHHPGFWHSRLQQFIHNIPGAMWVMRGSQD